LRFSTTAGETLRQPVIEWKLSSADNRILVGDVTILNIMESETINQFLRDAVEKSFHQMAMVHNVMEIWQGSQNQHATWKISHTQNQQITAKGRISDSEGNIKPFWSFIQRDRAATFKMLKRSPLPPAVCPTNLP
jgi:hypothetical protein